jgi:hypothetical protein
MSDEVRVIDPETGGAKGQKEAVIGDACPKALLELAKVYGLGRKKYARLNYLKGYNYSSSYDALQRHLMLFWSGEEKDGEGEVKELVANGQFPVTEEEAWALVLAKVDQDGNVLNSGLHHLAHATWHCLCLLAFVLRGIGKDDRP